MVDQVGPDAQFTLVQPGPYRPNDSPMGHHISIITKENSAVGAKRTLADTSIDKSLPSISRYSNIYVSQFILVLAAVIKYEIQKSSGLINGHPGKELLVAWPIIVHAYGTAPGIATIC